MTYDPSNVGLKGSIFGYPYRENEADLILVPIPWDVTVSYGAGTSKGPGAILDASPQLDLEVPGIINPWEFKVFMKSASEEIMNSSSKLRTGAAQIIEKLEAGIEVPPDVYKIINDGCRALVQQVYKISKSILSEGRFCGIVGGDHSTPLGLINALAEEKSFGILQIDAHMDLRDSYEGFHFSHASVMYNALKNQNISHLVQVGIRDYSPEEVSFAHSNQNRIKVFYNQEIKKELFEGRTWSEKVKEIIKELPQNVYISFDIDGLEPSLCPNTGTPVPGGLNFDQAVYLLDILAKSGKKIIGFDLSEVSPGQNEWDANVGARMLYRLCTYLAVSNNKLKLIE